MCQTIVISTTEEANRMREHLEACEAKARKDGYAAERGKPIRTLECGCCGEWYSGRQWWNQDCGYGMCDQCIRRYSHATEPGVVDASYGVAGIHFLIPADERANPPVVPDRGWPLYGIDERLRIECDGSVFWKGTMIEHYSHGALANTQANRATARELIQRCETIEGRGDAVNMGSVIWHWGE
jgi:hypothetical protein